MSQSHRPTRAPVWSNATARLAATVDLPTPPLPLATAITCLTSGIRVAPMPAPAPPGGAWISIKTFALRIPSIPRNARSASFLIAAGTFGSFVASASCTLTSPLLIWIDFTKPNDTMSRVKPGYFTDFNAVFTCSSEIDILEPYVRCPRGKPRAAAIDPDSPVCSEFGSRCRRRNEMAARRLSQRSLGFATQTRRGIRLHGVRRQMEIENSVFATGKFQDEQTLRGAKIKLDVASADARIFRRLCVPVPRHPIAVGVEFRLNVSKSFEGLASWRFHFEFEKRCRPIEVENMRLSCIPNSQTRCSDGCDRDTNHHQPDEQPDASHAAPVECG